MNRNTKSIFDNLFLRYPQLENCRYKIKEAYDIIMQCYKNGGKILICGNGGSAADSEHIVGELMKGFMLKRVIKQEDREKLAAMFPEEGQYLSENLQGVLPAISLVSQSALSSAFINDVAPDMVFAQQVYGYAQAGDVLIGLSTLGNSKNVINAIKVAKAFGIKTIGLAGECRGSMRDLCDASIWVPENETYKIQELHLPVYHTLCAMVESEFF